MTRMLVSLLCLLLATASLSAQIREDRPYPEFGIGVSGIRAAIEPGRIVTVQSTMPGSPAEGKVEQGDVILAANGQSLEVSDPRVPLGEALGQAEATDGRFVLTVRRGNAQQQVIIDIPVIGRYSDTWPLDCAKSQAIIAQTAQLLVEGQQDDGWFRIDGVDLRGDLMGCMATLFLLSTGETQYMPTVERFVKRLAQEAERAHQRSSAWHVGYQGILLAEYYLKTGDRSVLAGLENLCRLAAEGQAAGSWGHGFGPINPGYVQSGQMNSAGVTVFQMLALARECGITASEEAFQRALIFFWRMVGHGSVAYGDHRAEMHAATNGRNAKLACALAVINAEPYTTGAQHLAKMVAESYYAFEGGHTGGGFNVMWRGIALPLLHQADEALAQHHRDQLAWYYDLCRLPGGSFRMLPSAPNNATRYTGRNWGYAVALTYTAPRRTLRITGAKPTQYSVRTPDLPELPWGTPRDLIFISREHAPGFGSDDEPPHVIREKLSPDPQVPAAYAERMLRHYNPFIRTRAAYTLASINDGDAHRAVARALQDNDPRVRRAACDAISRYTNWGMRIQGQFPQEVVSRQFVPGIERILRDPNAAWWEIDGALWALANAPPADIRRNGAVIRRHSQSEEWYLRTSAFWAVAGLGRQITSEEFLFLADMYVKSRHVYERGAYDSAITWLLNRQRAQIADQAVAEFVRRLGGLTQSVMIAKGYDDMAAYHEAIHRVMMTMARFNDPPYHVIIPDLVKYMQSWKPTQHGAWLITGNNWQPGLVRVTAQMGPEAAPLIEAFRRCLNQFEWDENDRTHNNCREALDKAISDFESKHGRR